MFRQGPDFHFGISEVEIARVNCERLDVEKAESEFKINKTVVLASEIVSESVPLFFKTDHWKGAGAGAMFHSWT